MHKIRIPFFQIVMPMNSMKC